MTDRAITSALRAATLAPRQTRPIPAVQLGKPTRRMEPRQLAELCELCRSTTDRSKR
jgi:hypothetical protein